MTPDSATRYRRVVIESLGVYLPPREVSTDEVIQGCRNEVRFPLQRMTGIKSRHVVRDGEFAIDLAKEAIERCLAGSRHGPEDIDILISVAIARVDGPDFMVSFEPSTALQLKKQFGLRNALVFDVRSACSGMFAGVNIVDALLRQGTIGCGLVVSGEYITHLTKTAQIEIDESLDSRLACLTLGDSGAAVLLEGTSNPDVGFAAIDLLTLGGYADCCVAGPTDQEHGGAIMFTDSLKMTEAAARHGSDHALRTLRDAGWSPTDFHHLIMHQTSRTAMTSATRAINHLMKRRVCHEGNTIDNLERRANTATTTHFVALHDNIRNGRIRSGDRVLFAISGSGLTIGTALYTLDDLPDRIAGDTPAPRTSEHNGNRHPMPRRETSRIRIESVGVTTRERVGDNDSLSLLRFAADDCLRESSYKGSDLGLVIHAGTYRSRFIMEPAMAAFLAGEFTSNVNSPSVESTRTLAFDIFNGGVSVLNACWVAQQMIGAQKATTAMVVTSEVENNAENFPADLLGIEETGTAFIVEQSSGGEGFGPFLFRAFPEHNDAFTSFLTNRDGKQYLRFHRGTDLEQRYITAIVETVQDFLRAEELELSEIARIFPPQLSVEFISELSTALNVPREVFVEAVTENRDLFTASLPFALQLAREQDLVREGDVGLFVSVGSGIQVACALYHF
ncbi:MAG: 3-oxoacyl-[acyl-carrier-protein] synthase III C-terminal domain-containing protein [Gemmatimonadales bacterium]